MFKNKSLLLGLGIGLIVSTLMLQMMGAADKFENQELFPEAEEMDEARLSEEAERLGYSLVVKDAVYYSEAELAARIEEATKQALADAEPIVINRKSFVILAGMRPSAIADMLVELELIVDKDAFLAALKEQRVTTKIRSGVYTFEGAPGMDEIIQAISFD